MKSVVQRCVSGMRPTGSLHLGNYFGALSSWLTLQDEMECLFFIADLHALTTHYDATGGIAQHAKTLLLDWLACGLSPEKCIIFSQSSVPEHAELALFFSMVTPLSWLERVPTYKDVMAESSKDLSTYGFLGYPVLMSADIALYNATIVPVGEDQLPHLELAREIIRRANTSYGVTLTEPKAYLNDTTKYLGLDGRKMSKSYNNAIYLSDTPETVVQKVRSMITDTKRVKRTDKGDPARCLLFPFHERFSSAAQCQQIKEDCSTAKLGCVDCKKILVESLMHFFEPIHARYAFWETQPLEDIIADGNKKAQHMAQDVMQSFKDLMRW